MNIEFNIDINAFTARKVMGELSASMDKLQNLAKNIKPLGFAGFDKLKNKVKGVTVNVTELNTKLDLLTATRDLSIDTRQIRQLNREIESTQKQIDKLTSSGRNKPFDLGKLGGSVASLVGNLGANLVTSAVSGAVSGATDLIQTSMQVKALNESIKFSGGAEGSKNLEFLTQTANKYGMSITETRVAFQQLSGAFMGTKLAGEPMRQIFNSIVVAGRAMNMSSEQMQGSILALGQMMSKGKVSAEELRGQLGERLPGAFQIAARSMGVTSAQLDEMLADGKVMSEDFLPKFAAELQRTFGAQAGAQANALPARMERIKNTIEGIKLSVFEKLEPLLSKAVGFADSFLKNLTPITNAIAGLEAMLAPLGMLIGQVFGGNGAVSFANQIASLVTFISPLIGILANIIQQMMISKLPFIEAIFNILAVIREPLFGIIEVLGEAFLLVMPLIQELVMSFLDFTDVGFHLKTLLGGVKMALQGIIAVFRLLFAVLMPIVKGLLFVVGKIISAILMIVDIIVNVLGAALKVVFEGFAQLFNLLPNKTKILVGTSGNQSETQLFGNDRGTSALDVFTKEYNATPPAVAPQGVKSGLESISAGGSKPTTIVINNLKFAENNTVNTTTIERGISDMEKQFEEMLLRVVNGVSMAI